MALQSIICALLLVAQLSLALSGEHVLHEKRETIPHNWVRRAKAPPASILSVRVALNPRNVDQGPAWLKDISDPRSANFGHHWTAQQIYDTFAPDLESVQAVREWLLQSGVEAEKQMVASSLGYISFQASVAEVESLFQTKYHVWQHKSGSHAVSCDEYSVPAHLKGVIDFITPSTGLHAVKSSQRAGKRHQRSHMERAVHALEERSTGSSTCNDTNVAPACIRQMYGIPLGTHAVEGNDFGLFEVSEGYDQLILDQQFTNLAPFIPNGTHPIGNSIEGGTQDVSVEQAGPESMLDLAVVYPIIYPQAIRYLDVFAESIPSLGYLDDFLDALDASYCTSPGAKNNVDLQFPNQYWNHSLQCGVYKPPNVISISYGLPVPSLAYLTRQCHEYLKLGLQGVSVVVASGDRGAFPVAGGCQDKYRTPPVMEFPAGCPYTLSVGATKLGKTSSDAEEAASDKQGAFTSGGGFSSMFSRPWYQDATVEHFFNISTKLPARNTYNRSGRGWPDVSAVGQSIALYEYVPGKHSGSIRAMTHDGTSASAPLVAGLITRINGMRLEAGKKPLGFLNPIFYQHPEMFTDVTKGYNNGCPVNGSKSLIGPAFYCVDGWDPVTGLGTPNFPKMVAYLTALK